MVTELMASLGLFKSMLDVAKGLKDINDATVRNAAIIELQEKILAAQMHQTTLIEHVSELKAKVARLETWDAGKEQYVLAEFGPGAFAYIRKREARGGELPHYVCANCYEQRKKSILQHTNYPGTFGHVISCSSCGTKTRVEQGYIPPS